ncbi:hypothetical protein ACIPI6_31670 [Pseudomonas protegens]|uniref:hypothetical protein n=1 Tax=Pseudomonas protegens TaxID=380021 RepID=UPI0037FECE16
MSLIKERPILFNGPMVRAILEGRKTVTRRLVKGDQIPRLRKGGGEWPWIAVGQHDRRYGFVITANTEDECAAQLGAFGACPYGRRGDRLWVRETTEVDEKTSAAVRLARYSADLAPVIYRHPEGEYDGSVAHWDYPRRSRPSIHMPRWACRILLEITAVRVERLQDISRSDIRAEGLQCPPELGSDDVSPNYRDWYPAAWRELWDSINGADSWNANPWVWVVEFRRVASP